jgi:opacity protein-like surface antigen
MPCQRLFLFCSLMLFAFASKAQTSFGLEAGVSESYLSTNISNRAASSIGYDIGYTINVPVQFKIKQSFYIETLLGITQKNYSINRTDSFAGITQSFVNTYLQLPVMAKYIHGKQFQWFVDAGGYLSYWLSGRQEGTIPNIFGQSSGFIGLASYNDKYQFNSETDNRLEFGWVAGAGVQYHVNNKYMLTASCRYYQSLTDQQKKYEINEIPQYNQTFTFSIGGMKAFK